MAIVRVPRSAVGQVGARLMDAVDPALVDQAHAAVISVEGVEQLRLRWIGPTLRAEADVTVAPRCRSRKLTTSPTMPKPTCYVTSARLAAATSHVSPAGIH